VADRAAAGMWDNGARMLEGLTMGVGEG
jgi:hypothetical protein